MEMHSRISHHAGDDDDDEENHGWDHKVLKKRMSRSQSRRNDVPSSLLSQDAWQHNIYTQRKEPVVKENSSKTTSPNHRSDRKKNSKLPTSSTKDLSMNASTTTRRPHPSSTPKPAHHPPKTVSKRDKDDDVEEALPLVTNDILQDKLQSLIEEQVEKKLKEIRFELQKQQQLQQKQQERRRIEYSEMTFPTAIVSTSTMETPTEIESNTPYKYPKQAAIMAPPEQRLHKENTEEEEEEDDDEDGDEYYQYPQDAYSFMILYNPNRKHLAVVFAFGFFVFAIQVSMLMLFANNTLALQDDNNRLGVPGNVELTVRLSQILAGLITVLFAGASLGDMWLGAALIYRHRCQIDDDDDNFNNDDDKKIVRFLSKNSIDSIEMDDMDDMNFRNEKIKAYRQLRRRILFSSVLRLIQGSTGLMMSFLLIVQSETVFDLVLNFTALQFLSELDDIAFASANAGHFGRNLQHRTIEIEAARFPRTKKPKRPFHYIYFWCSVTTLLFAGIGYVAHAQISSKYLCHHIRVDFGDEIVPELGPHNGCYQLDDTIKNAGRVQYRQEGNDEGRFGYCSDRQVWSFFSPTDNEDFDPCKNILAMSSLTETFEIQTTQSQLWYSSDGIPLDFFVVSCTGACESTTVTSWNDVENLCTELFLRSSIQSQSRISSRFYSILDGASSHGHPIFVGDEEDDRDAALIFFTGRRWAATTIQKLLGRHGNLSDFFNDNTFHTSLLKRENITLLSSAVSSDKSLEPLGLLWYSPKESDQEDSFPAPDLGRPVDPGLLCGLCNNQTNPCFYEGICTVDGICSCANGATGRLCEQDPINNGHCDEFFNTDVYDFDGGDCCGGSCNSPDCGWSNDLASAFGTMLPAGSIGYPTCRDPSMAPITITWKDFNCERPASQEDSECIVSGTNDGGLCESANFFLSCDDRIMMNVDLINGVPLQNASETILIPDGSNCELSLSFSWDPPCAKYIYLDMTAYDTLSSNVIFTTTFDSSTQNLPSLGVRHTLSYNFTALPQCLQSVLMNVVEPEALFDSELPETVAAKWLFDDPTAHSQCQDNPRLIDRYLLVTFFCSARFGRQGELACHQGELSRLVGAHCSWEGVTCNDDSSVTGLVFEAEEWAGVLPTTVGFLSNLVDLDLESLSIRGTIPTEIGLLSDLADLDLEYNELTGTIPTELALLSNLVDFDLEYNAFTGTIPTELSRLQSVEEIDVEGNILSGPIPSELGVLSSLIELHLGKNLLTSTIPSEIGRLSNLILLNLESNNLTGTIPENVCKLCKEINTIYPNEECDDCGCYICSGNNFTTTGDCDIDC